VSGPRALLLDAANRLFEAATDDDVFEGVEAGRFPAAHWRAIEENGLADLLLPEAAGGAGVDFGDAMAVARAAGSFALPLPLVETIVGRRLLVDAGLEPAAGPLGLMTAAPATDVAWPNEIAALVVADQPDSVGWVAAADVDFEAATSSAGEPVGRLCQRPAIPVGQSVRPGSGPNASEVMATARTAMIAGAMERILDLTIEHVQGRVQFGRPLARFQAVQQMVAVLASHAAVVGVASDTAIAAIEAAPEGGSSGAGFKAACAKARASEACYEVTRIAHQLHGAIGYTREHDLQRFTRRLWTWRDADGDEGYWQAQVGAAVIDAGGGGLWPLLAGA
jgi:acyl-CoA dehydrogenase